MTAATTIRPVREVVRMVEDGLFRVPAFQRPFVWSPEEISAFLESVLAGLPTGPILTVRKPAGAERVRFGPILLDAPAVPDALWIVDGGQRLTALTSVLRDRLSFAYDFRSGRIVEYPGLVPESLPLGVLATDEDFWLWQSEHPILASRAEQIRQQFLDSPVILSEVPDDVSPSEVFTRINTGGVRLRREDLERARENDEPHDLHSLLDRLSSLRFGRFSEDLIHESTTAVNGSLPQTWHALRVAVAWLRDEAAVPHLDVWPRQDLLPVLARFYALNRHPSVRARILLRRWLWRAMAEPAPDLLHLAISGRDSVDGSRLLATAPAFPPSPDAYLAAVGHELALTTIGPRSFVTGEPLVVTAVLSEWGREAFRTVLGEPILSPWPDGDLNAILQAPMVQPSTLASHALDQDSLGLLLAGKEPEFRERRRRLLSEAFQSSSGRLAAWGASDRPAISALLVSDEDDGNG
jgi:hypothetical protein